MIFFKSDDIVDFRVVEVQKCGGGDSCSQAVSDEQYLLGRNTSVVDCPIHRCYTVEYQTCFGGPTCGVSESTIVYR